MIKIKKLYLLPLVLFLISCDPPHYISFINTTKNIAKVKINLHNNVSDPAFTELAIADSIVFNLRSKDTAHINFGIGNWGSEGIKEIAKDIKSLEIETSEIKTVYKSTAAIETLLSKNLKGVVFKSEIAIEIE